MDEQPDASQDDTPLAADQPADLIVQQQDVQAASTYGTTGAVSTEEIQQSEPDDALERRWINLSSVEISELKRVGRLFVEPPQYASFIQAMFTTADQRMRQRRPAERIWLVSGPKGAGRRFTALRLALELTDMEEDCVELRCFFLNGSRSLQEIVYEANLPPWSVLIFDDVFSTGEMSAKSLLSCDSGANVSLMLRNVWLIFTVPEIDSEFPLSEAASRYKTLHIGMPDLGEVFHKYVDEYFPVERYPVQNQLLMNQWGAVTDVLRGPCTAADINYYFSRYQENPAQIVPSILDRTAGQSTETIDRWFDCLPSLNYKLYALFVVLLGGIGIGRLNQIYAESVAHLRRLGMDNPDQFIEPGLISQQALFSAIHLNPSNQRLRFVRDEFRAEAAKQVEHYYRLLSLVIDVFATTLYDIASTSYMAGTQYKALDDACKLDPSNMVLERRRQFAEQQYGEACYERDVIASAIARIVVCDPSHIRSALDVLARHDNTFVVVAAGSVFAYLVQTGDRNEDVLRVLTDWAASGEYALMRACAVAVSRIYVRMADHALVEDGSVPDARLPSPEAQQERARTQGVLRDLCDLLTMLAANSHQTDARIQESVVYAVVYIGSRHARDMVALVEQWLQHDGTEGSLWMTGTRAFTRLFRGSTYLDAGRLDDSAYPLLRLLKPVLQTDSRAANAAEKRGELVRTSIKAAFNWHRMALRANAGPHSYMGQDDWPYEEDAEVQAPDTPLRELAAQRAEQWEERVAPVLLQTITDATQERRAQIRRALLSIWPRKLTEDTERVQRVIGMLMTRLHVMDGTPLDLPQAQRAGLLIVDEEAWIEPQAKVFALARELSLLVPVYIMRLGDARACYSLAPLEPQVAGSNVRPLTCSTDLAQEGQHAPPLIMPLLAPYEHTCWRQFTPENTAFVAVYSTGPVSDLIDLAHATAAGPVKPAARPGVFSRAQEAPARQLDMAHWAWEGKLLLVTQAVQPLPPLLQGSIPVINDIAPDAVLAPIRRQIAASLHQLTTPEDMWCDLAMFQQWQSRPTVASVAALIEECLPLLSSVSPAHPRRDAAMTIAWSVLSLARADCEQVVEVVASLLGCEHEEIGVGTRRQVGLACVRMLFNFYDALPQGASVAKHRPLLQLLPAFYRTGDASDVFPVWLVLLRWSQSTEWSAVLACTRHVAGGDHAGRELFEGLNSFRQRDAQRLRQMLDDYMGQGVDTGGRVLALRLRNGLGPLAAGTLPELVPDERFYGIVIFDGSKREVADKAAEVAAGFASLRHGPGALRRVVLTLHRLGSEEIVGATRTRGDSAQTSLCDGRQRPSLLGPILERYDSANVGFVVILGSPDIIDYIDWAERESWCDRIWTISRQSPLWKNQPGTHEEMDVNSEALLRAIAARIG